MRTYILVAAAALLMAGPAMAQDYGDYGGAWDGKVGTVKPTTMSTPSGRPYEAAVIWQPYSEELNQDNGPITIQPNQNYPDNGRMTAPPGYYGTPHGSGTPTEE